MSHLLFWSLTHQKRECKRLSYPETLVKDNDTDILNLVNIMENTNLWKRLVDSLPTVVAAAIFQSVDIISLI